VAPKAAPPRAQATPPRATTAMRARSGGPANHWPQQPFPDLSEGDLKIEQNGKQIFSKAAGKWQGKM